MEPLSDIVKSIELEARTLKIKVPKDPWTEFYHSVLISYPKIIKPKLSLELGHGWGWGNWAMSHFSQSVETCDINTYGWENRRAPLSKNITFKLIPERSSCINLPFEKYDFIFVDIDHKGDLEEKIHNNIVKSKYSGLVFYDDISLNRNMEIFWSKISNEKVMTSWHGNAGFGVVRYGPIK